MDFLIKWLFGSEDDDSQVPTILKDDSYKAVTFKINATDFGKFDGQPEHWFPFKNKTESTLGVAGFSTLIDDKVPMKDTEGNRRLYYLLEGATNNGAASHIVKQHKVLKDGRAAWLALKDWYEGKIMVGDIAKTCRIKLQALELLPRGDANTYINEFIRLKDQLEEAGEGERPTTLVEQFLDQIKDSKYEVTVSNLRMDNNKTLERCIEAIREHDLVLARLRIKDHRLFKIRRLNTLSDTSTYQSGKGYIQPEVWASLTPAQRKAIIQARAKQGDKGVTYTSEQKRNTEGSKTEAQKARRARAIAKRKAKLQARKDAKNKEIQKEPGK